MDGRTGAFLGPLETVRPLSRATARAHPEGQWVQLLRRQGRSERSIPRHEAAGVQGVAVRKRIPKHLHKKPGLPARPLADRFFEKTCPEPTTGCLLWTGALDNKGAYGSIGTGEPSGRGRQMKTAPAHRVAWFLAHGRWPSLHILHKCDTPACVNVDHLFEGTDLDNMRDCANKGRWVGHKVLTIDLVREIRARWQPGSTRALAEEYDVSRSTILRTRRLKVWGRVII